MPFENDNNSIDMTQLTPGRRIEIRHPVILPSGRVREFYEIIETHCERPLTYVTHREFGIRPGHDCACQPLGYGDISECSNLKCLSVTCKMHSATCFFCGRVYCSACVNLVHGFYFITNICHTCQKELSKSKLRKVWDKLMWR
jgi:hypothetical protein